MIRKLVMALLCSIGVAQVYGQTVNGTVLNERSEGIPYVKIVVKNNNKPFLSDGKGQFQVQVSNLDSAVLIVSAMGYQKQEVASFTGNGLTQEINVEALKAGIYTIQIATAAGNSSKQFVKK